MFGDKLTAATAKIKALAALVLAAGFSKLNAETLADEKTEAAATVPSVADFTAHLDGVKQAAVKAATDPLNTRISGLETQLATSAAAAIELAAFKQGLADAGVNVGAFVTAKDTEGKDDAEKAKNAAAKNAAMVKTAIETATAAKATKQIAAAGHPNAIETPVGEDTGAKDASLIGGYGTPASKEEFLKNKRAIAATNPGLAQVYFRKHKAKFGL